MFNVEIFSDFVCPFCYIGKKELTDAAEELGIEDQLNVSYSSYELNPQAPTAKTQTYIEFLANARNISEDEVKEEMKALIERAESIGLPYNIENLYNQNTLKAHRLAKLAKEEGLEEVYQNRLFQAVFEENEFLSDNGVLTKLASDVGLDETKTQEVLENESKNLGMIILDKTRSQEMGIQGAPFFIFNEQYAISGAQPREAFLQALKKVAEIEGIEL